MGSTNQPLVMLVEKLGVQRQINEVLFVVFPGDEFAQHFDLFKNAVNRPNSLQPFISELQKQLNTGAFSHTTGAMYHFLAMDSKFEVFTRDYVRRCCDMVEYIAKRKVLGRLNLEPKFEEKSLGIVISEFKNKHSRQFPDGLLEALSQFNRAIYCTAKHDSVSKQDERMFSVADAIAITFIVVRLCQRLDDFQRKYPFC
jgi:hypothetical protein